MGGSGDGGDGVKTVAAMVLFQVVFAGLNIFYKLAVSDGMDLRVLIAYRYLFATAFLAPLSYFMERRKRTKLTWRVLVLSFMCGLIGGSLAQNLYLAGMQLTSTTFASATTNLVPAVTFVLALAFRHERLAIHHPSGQAKLAGTFLGVGGATLLTFYKGPDITPWNSHVNLAAALAQRAAAASGRSPHHPAAAPDFAMGSLLCISSCFFAALWLIVQAELSKEYRFHYTSTALMCGMTALQSAALALCFGTRDAAQWRQGLAGVRLLAVAYSGVLASGVMLVVLAWCVRRRGPLFVSVFSPLMLLVVAVLSSLLLGERLHLGTALGAVLIVMGLYAVLWGKGHEKAPTEVAMVAADKPPADGEEEDHHIEVPIVANSI
ncbi:unnamed protein product [Urochloa decumbens]|uniref:WAT1-related protein n=1 Tax=Urochloa decumbens TaxID=240449 RepID=A0ABC8W0A6_9POAL